MEHGSYPNMHPGESILVISVPLLMLSKSTQPTPLPVHERGIQAPLHELKVWQQSLVLPEVHPQSEISENHKPTHKAVQGHQPSPLRSWENIKCGEAPGL